MWGLEGVPIAALMGGVGLFLLGMELMTDGLRVAAGPALKRILTASTRTRWRGLGAGMLVTAVVQSSSAVTVAVIGFINAGLLSLGPALWVLFGSNVGTTMTGWIVAVLGFGVRIDALALPMIALGMALRLSGTGTRRAALGSALAGFGLLFLGIGMLKEAFGGVAQQVTLPVGSGVGIVLAQLAIGLVLTVLMQSSSASLTLALTAAQSGLLTAAGAAAVVIGANIGTTVTAVLAAVGATPNARRAASAHVLFNLITGAVALALLPWLVQALLQAKQAMGLPPSPALTVALFHTVFNVMGVVLMWPLVGRLAHWLDGRFRRAEEDEARPRYLDATVLTVPVLALDALQRELDRLRQRAAHALRTVLALRAWPSLAAPAADDDAVLARLSAERVVAQALQHAVADFVVRLQRDEMSTASAERLPDLLRIARYAEVATEQAALAAAALAELPPAAQGVPVHELQVFHHHATALLDASPGTPTDPMAQVESAYATLKAALLRAGAQGLLPVERMDTWLRGLSDLRRGLQQLDKAHRLLAAVTSGNGQPAVVPDSPVAAG